MRAIFVGIFLSTHQLCMDIDALVEYRYTCKNIDILLSNIGNRRSLD